jgi:hypothetical protein
MVYFNLHTEISLYLQIIKSNIYRMYSIFIQVIPCIVDKTTPLDLLGEPASLVVVTNTHPPLSLFCQELSHPLAFTPSHPFTPPSSNYIIYTDDINNLGRPRPGQEQWYHPVSWQHKC